MEELKRIPGNNPSQDLELILKAASSLPPGGFAKYLERISTDSLTTHELFRFAVQFTVHLRDTSEAVLFCDWLKDSTHLTVLDRMNVYLTTPFFADCFLLSALSDPEVAHALFVVCSAANSSSDRFVLKQAVFAQYLHRKDTEIVMRLLKATNPAHSTEAFSEFSTLLSQVPALLSNNPSATVDLANYLANLSLLVSQFQRDFLDMFVASIAGLLPRHSMHPVFALLFSDINDSIIDHTMGLSDAPCLTRASYIDHALELSIDNASPAAIHNYLMRSRDMDLIKQLPADVQLPYLTEEDAIHGAIKDAISTGHHDEVLAFLKHIAMKRPHYLKPYTGFLSTLSYESIADLLAVMVKASILDFSKLWPVVSKHSLHKDLLYEGIIQAVRTGTSGLTYLRHYFKELGSDGINWSAVADVYPDSIEVAAMMFHEKGPTEHVSDSRSLLEEYRASFLSKLHESNSQLHQQLALPSIFYLIGTQDSIDWQLKYLPILGTSFEFTLSCFALFTYAKAYYRQNDSIPALMRVFAAKEVFAHAVLYSVYQTPKMEAEFTRYLQHESYLQRRIASTLAPFLSALPRSIFDLQEFQSDRLFMKLHKCRTIRLDVLEEMSKTTRFASLQEFSEHQLVMAFAYFLSKDNTVVAHDSAISTMQSLLLSSSLKQQQFAVYAMAQAMNATLSPELTQNSALSLHIAYFSIRHNDLSMLSEVVSRSSDIALLPIVKGSLRLLDDTILHQFLSRSAPLASTNALLDALSILAAPEQISIIMHELGSRESILDCFTADAIEKVHGALLKLPTESIDSLMYSSVSNFTLMCAATEFHINIHKLCQSMLAGGSWTLAGFLCMQSIAHKHTDAYVESLLVISKEPSSFLDVFELLILSLIAKERRLRSLMDYLLGHPGEITRELMRILGPSVLASAKYLKQAHIKRICTIASEGTALARELDDTKALLVQHIV